METSRGENTALIMRFHYNHLFSIIQTKSKILSQKSAQKKNSPGPVRSSPGFNDPRIMIENISFQSK